MSSPIDPNRRATHNPPAGGAVPPSTQGGDEPNKPSVDDRDNLGRILAGDPPIEQGSPRAQSSDPKVKVTVKYDPDAMSAKGTKVVGTFPAGTVDVAKLTKILSGNDDAGLKALMGASAMAAGGKSSYLTGTSKIPIRVSLNATMSGNKITSKATGEKDPNNPTYTTNDSTYTLETGSDGSLTVTLELGDQKLEFGHLPPEKRASIEKQIKDPVIQDGVPDQLEAAFKKTFKKFPQVAPK